MFNAEIGISTAGYAEPPESENSSGAYAFYAIWDKAAGSSEPVRSGKLLGAKPERVGNQRLYAELALRELVAYLVSRHGADLSFQDVLRIERLADGRYKFGERIVNDVLDLPGAIRAMKKAVPITALKIKEPFEVLTSEGLMQGAVGDWLLKGVVGEVYICPDHVFEKSYNYPL
ncbi:MAG TPA: hypothetical protein VMB83_11150 [Roseiarcus sp.]|nr:hypothetical protein [Roseiarcus sp.]